MLQPSIGGIRYFSFTQTTPSATWSINHALGQTPMVDVNVIDNGSYKKAFPLSITHVDDNNITITWSSPRVGNAMLAAGI